VANIQESSDNSRPYSYQYHSVCNLMKIFSGFYVVKSLFNK